MKSPFKFLDAYELADKEVFFGREKEIDTLYRMVYQSNLILLYGYSGTGKTSLIRCGLAGRFDGPQWYPFFIRKGENINLSIRTALAEALGTEELPDDVTPVEMVEAIVDEYLSPVYLIFDQFEELFILGSPEEQARFARDIKELLEEDLSCKVIFVIREEYLGALYQLEQVLPKLFDFKLRVEPMNKVRVKKVLRSSFSAFNISLEAPEEDRLEEMIQNVSGERALIQLPYLQVYLDMLWREGLERGAGGVEQGAGGSWPHLEFGKKEIAEFGTIEGVLQRFLQQQELAIVEQLQASYPHIAIDQNPIRAVLDVFVTGEGTKRPVPFQMEEDLLVIPPRVMEQFPLDNPVLTEAILALENSRILRVRDESYELAHDSLAALIDEERTEEQKRHNRIRQEIRVLHQTGQFLSRKLLTAYAADIPRLGLDADLQQFVQKSEAYALEQEKEAEKRRQRELELTREKLAAEERAGRRQRVFSVAVSLVALIAIAAGVYAFGQNREVQRQSMAIQEASFQNEIAAATALKNAEQYGAALAQLRKLEGTTGGLSPAYQQQLDSIQEKWQQLHYLIGEADSLAAGEAAQWRNALARYQEAHELDTEDIQIEEKRDALIQQIAVTAKDYYNRGRNICNFVSFDNAAPLFRVAAELEPDNATYQQAVTARRCPQNISQ